MQVANVAPAVEVVDERIGVPLAALVPLVRSELRSQRRFNLGIGISLLVVGLATIVLFAATVKPRDGLAVGIGMLLVVLVLPGAMLVRADGRERAHQHRLIVALTTSPDQIESLKTEWLHGAGGYMRIAEISLKGGHKYTCQIPSHDPA